MDNSLIYIRDIKKLQHLFSHLKTANKLTLFGSLEEKKCKKFNINYISFSAKEEKEYLIRPEYFNSWNKVISELGNFLSQKHMLKIGYNFKNLYSAFRNYGVNLNGNIFDIETAIYLVGEEVKKHSYQFLKHDNLLENNLTPASVIFSLYKKLSKELEERGMYKLFKHIEMPLVEILSSMELKGISIDIAYITGLFEEISKKLNSVKKSIYEVSKEEFNINSPKQVSYILFEKLGLPVIKRAKTGPSTDTEVLQKLSTMHSLPNDLLEYRELKKLQSSYVKKFLNLAKRCKGKIHTTFDQCVASTGRLISNNPNLQNIPSGGKWAEKLRKAFVAEPESVLLSADYSQVELRILAHFSEDDRLIEKFINNEDIHLHTASLIFDIPEEKVKNEERKVAKTVNFGIIYGISPYGLSRQLNISTKKARKFIDKYFEIYPRVKEYLRLQKENVDRGYIKTIFGRRRYIREKDKNSISNTSLHRIAVNTPIQGTAADIIKLAMVKIRKQFLSSNLESYMILQIHDELIFNVFKEEERKVSNIVKQTMENAVDLKVPIKVDMKKGKNWSEMKELEWV